MKISFWEDKWLGQRTLKQLFPDIYNMNQQQGSSVGEMWIGLGWNLTYRRLLNDWEIQRLTAFYNTLEQFTGTSKTEDCVIWQRGRKGKFYVRSAYKEYNHSNNQIGCWPWKLIWKVKISYKVACFTWHLAREAILTQDNLIKRGYQLGSRCYLCEDHAETVNHHFLHCRVTDQVWKIFINLRGIRWVMPGRIREVLASWKRDSEQSSQKER